MTLIHGDCIEVMAGMDAESIDAIVTDPPYGLGFMGKAWDSPAGAASWTEAGTALGIDHLRTTERSGSMKAGKYDRSISAARGYQAWCEAWATEALRVAKPGAHLLAFGGTRTYHRLACAIEDAGWEIRDCLVWAYASGFPKSANPGRQHDLAECRRTGMHRDDPEHVCLMVAPEAWYGLGTALKPAWEPIALARKPLRGTVAANVQRYGTGVLTIDGCRIGTDGGSAGAGAGAGAIVFSDGLNGPRAVPVPGMGRWPANLILTDELFDGDTPGVVGGGTSGGMGVARILRRGTSTGSGMGYGSSSPEDAAEVGYGDSGTYSRFFIIPKAARAEREPIGLRDFEARRETAHRRTGDMDTPYLRGETMRRNTHPTVKPLDLMRHLVRLVTPPGGTVLDPFLGSGTTALAAEMEGFRWIGIEKEAEYVAIAEARLNGTQRGMGLGA
jgi:site-specific DNA-methyltransferase (adenine-specific)